MNKPATIVPAQTEQARDARFTTAEFLRMAGLGAFDDMKIELIRGELKRINPPMSMHALMQGTVLYRLAQEIGRAHV